MKLHLLGVNGPFPESRGATSGYLLDTDENLFQFDMGSGVLSSLTALTAPETLSALFISHWHFDHTADLPVLMYRLQAMQRVLSVYGPADPEASLYHLVSTDPCFSFVEISAGDVLRIGSSCIRVRSARHPVPAVGFTVTSEGKTFGYTGDTNTLPSLPDDYRGCDLLIADGLFPRDMWTEEKPHLSAELAARFAADAGVGSLIISHLNPFYPRSTLLEEARSVFLSSELAEAGVTISL